MVPVLVNLGNVIVRSRHERQGNEKLKKQEGP